MNQVVEKLQNVVKDVILGNELADSIMEAVVEIKRLEALVADKSEVEAEVERLKADIATREKLYWPLNWSDIDEDYRDHYSLESHLFDNMTTAEQILYFMNNATIAYLENKRLKEQIAEDKKPVAVGRAKYNAFEGVGETKTFTEADVERLKEKHWDEVIKETLRLNEEEIAELKDTAIIDGMKAECFGEFSFIKTQNNVYDDKTESYADISVKVYVPWDTMKDIYKMMHESKLRLIAAKEVKENGS